MTTDGLHLGGESSLIDGAMRSSRSKEDGYRVVDEIDIDEDDDSEEEAEDDGTVVVELGQNTPVSSLDDAFAAPPDLEESKAKATREWERDVGTVELIDDPVRMYLREIGRVVLLKAPQERDLARKFEAKRYVEQLDVEMAKEDGSPPNARDMVTHMLEKVADNQDIVTRPWPWGRFSFDCIFMFI